QAEALRKAAVPIDCVLEIDLPDDEIIERLSGRRVHPASGRTYHVAFNPPRIADRDDVTGEPLVQRPDDAQGPVKHPLATYHAETEPLVDYYKERSAGGVPRYLPMNAAGSVESVR